MTTSVALCTYNGEKYLAEQLDSILSQDIAVDEIIIFDDCSFDKTWEILNDYRKKFPEKIKIFRNEENIGIIKNFEHAIENCSKDLIFLSDQDDIWKPFKVETILKYFENNPDKQAVFHDLQLLDNNKILPSGNWYSIFFQPKNPHGISLFHYLILLGNVVTGASLIFKNPKKKLSFNTSSHLLLHDYQLALHFAAENSLGTIDNSLGIYRLHEDQQVGTHLNNRQKRKEIHDDFVNSSVSKKIKFYETKSKIWKGKLNLNDERKILQFIDKEISSLKEEYLKNLPFVQRLGTTINWAIRNKFKTKS